MEDISMRALRTLRSVDWVAAEDTRHTGILLKHYDIQQRLESYHDFNKTRKAPLLIQRLLRGASVAVVTDAGTPGISDPAFYLVREAIEKRIPVVPIPGPVAAVTGLVVSGLPTDRFVFEGFLPAKRGRRKRLSALSEEIRTLVLYESPHRLMRTLTDLLETLGDREAAVCRELTKKYEEIIRGNLSLIIDVFSRRSIRGEFVIVIQGQAKKNDKKIPRSYS
jgi:16S rRNA (cytidine1402-2'-O)-methyltransferase